MRALASGFEPSDYSTPFTINLVNNVGNNPNCQFCASTFNGTFSGNITFGGIPSEYTNQVMNVSYSTTQVNSLYNSSHNFSFFPPNLQNVSVTGELSGTVLTYTDKIWNYQGVPITINGTATFNSNFTNVTGAFTLSGGATGNVNFYATL